MTTATPPFPLQRVATRRQAVAALNTLTALRDALQPGLTATIIVEALQHVAPVAEAAD